MVANTGSHQLPPIGAVISFAAAPDFLTPDSSPGHVGVVSRVAVNPTTGSGTITVVGENQYPAVAGGGFNDDAFPMTVTAWQMKFFVRHDLYIQWLLLPPPPRGYERRSRCHTAQSSRTCCGVFHARQRHFAWQSVTGVA